MYAESPDFVGQSECKSIESSLAGTIETLVGDTELCGDTAGEDNGSALLPTKGRQDCLHKAHGSEEIDIELPLRVFKRSKFNRTADAETGIADNDINVRCHFKNTGDRPGDAAAVGDITTDVRNRQSVRNIRFAAAQRKDLPSSFSKEKSRCESDAAASSCDDKCFHSAKRSVSIVSFFSEHAGNDIHRLVDDALGVRGHDRSAE